MSAPREGDEPDRPDEGPEEFLAQLMRQLGAGGLPGGLAGGLPPGLAGGLPGGFPGLPPGVDPAQLMEQLSRDPAAMSQVVAGVQRLLATSGDGPVNWQMAHDLARQTASAGGDPVVAAAQDRAVVEALRVADLWLDQVTDLPSGSTTARAWSRAEWVEGTLAVWRRLAEPIATSVADAVASAMAQQAPPEVAPMLAGAGDVMRSVGGAVFGLQLGQAVGTLAREVVSATDVGLPLAARGTTALVPANTAAFAEGLEVPLDEVQLFLAAREAAHARLFAHVPWLRAHLLGAVEAYARGITIDASAIEEAVRSVDPSDPAALQEALASGLFEPERTPAQQSALERLETTLALVEGWVDELVAAAAGRTLPHAAALREAVRRRRATGGPAEHVLTSLVGLELRPRRLRDAARLWAVLEQASGRAARDAVWAHPDLLPTAEDLDDPEGYAARRAASEAAGAEVDAALARLLDGPDEPGGQAGEEPGEHDG